MANYGQVSYGSKGSDVTELQKLLNNNGYNLSVDGDFGSKTQAAVKDYQQKNGLDVDGIVGTNTWGALTKAQTPAQTTTAAAPQQEAPKFEYTPYTPSDTVAQAEALLQQQMANKPGEYQSTWEGQLNETIAQILNREKFSYDLNEDALYQQYKDQYVNLGKLAMMDTMGQAAAMTGGYGNSYAQSVGQQAYQGYLQQLNDKVPEFYQLALSQYNAEGQALRDNVSIMAQMEDQEYSRYMDQLTNYYTELGLTQDEARYQAEQDYNRWADGRNLAYEQFLNDRAYDYQVARDAVADQQWQAQFDESKRQYDEQMALSKSKSTGTTSTKRVEETPKEPDPVATPEVTDTDNTKLFRSSVMTTSEFARHGNRGTVNGKTYTNYNSYIEACLADWTDNNVPHGGQQLTDQEVEFLMDYYGL